MSKENKINGVYLGRFQPFHNGHLKAIDFALEHCDKLFIGICGANNVPNKENPFTAPERYDMIVRSLGDKIHLCKAFPIADKATNEQWMKHIDYVLPKYDIVFSGNPETLTICESFGKKIWKIPSYERDHLNATNIRELIRTDQPYEQLLPNGTKNVMGNIDGITRVKTIGTSILCKQCSAVVVPDAKFCSQCGKPVVKA